MEDGNKASVSPKRPMTIVEYSKFQRKVGADPFSGFISNECVSSPISE
jgi:ribosomal protein L34E